jgi:hypothetical protein
LNEKIPVNNDKQWKCKVFLFITIDKIFVMYNIIV